jgi:hypothetical protein
MLPHSSLGSRDAWWKLEDGNGTAGLERREKTLEREVSGLVIAKDANEMGYAGRLRFVGSTRGVDSGCVTERTTSQ